MGGIIPKIAFGSLAIKSPGGVDIPVIVRLTLTSPSEDDIDYFLTAHALDGSTVIINKDPDFPRIIGILASGPTTAPVTIRGLDIRGFPITETVNLEGAGIAPSIKAYSRIVSVDLPTVAATTVRIGTTNGTFGLPFRMTTFGALVETRDGENQGNINGITLGSTEAGQDYYGTWSPGASPDGSSSFTLLFVPTGFEAAGVDN